MKEAIEDFNGAVDGIRQICRAYTHEEIVEDEANTWSIYRLFEIIARASEKLSKEFKEDYSAIPWEVISNPRKNFIAKFREHGSDDLNIEKLWEMSLIIIKLKPLKLEKNNGII